MTEVSQAGAAYKWIMSFLPLHISLGPQDILGGGAAWAQSTMITQQGHHGSSWNTVNRSADLAGNPKLQEGKAPSVAHNATP